MVVLSEWRGRRCRVQVYLLQEVPSHEGRGRCCFSGSSRQDERVTATVRLQCTSLHKRLGNSGRLAPNAEEDLLNRNRRSIHTHINGHIHAT